MFDKQQLLSEIETAFTKLKNSVKGFPNDNTSVVVGNYTFKDVVAHIYEWGNFCTESLIQLKDRTITPPQTRYQENKSRFL